MPVESIKHTANHLFTVFNKYISLDEYCISVFDTLKQRAITLGLISNFDHPPQVREFMSGCSLDKYFTTIVISDEVGINKPDPSIFHLALEETGCHPQDAIFIGDSEEDIVGANDAGILSVLIDRDGHGKNFGQIKTISSLQDVLNFC
jgi:putative hydrolase of the HAD superfamily